MSIAHINRKARPDNPEGWDPDWWTSLCGRYLPYQFHLTGLKHAEACLEKGTMVQPCKKCLAAARAAARR